MAKLFSYYLSTIALIIDVKTWIGCVEYFMARTTHKSINFSLEDGSRVHGSLQDSAYSEDMIMFVSFRYCYCIDNHRVSTMDTLGRYPLSVILSFLLETEGVSLLITQKRYARQLLPIFRLRSTINGGKKNRHNFVVAPVQDPIILLERKNTKRLFRRKQTFPRNLTTRELALLEWKEASLSRPGEVELLRFLDNHADRKFQENGPILLVSYPRSGNTLVRTLLERSTGIVTGSDTRPDRGLSRELAEKHELVAEGVTQQVCFIKSHWPERVGNRIFSGKMVVLLVRNPYDAIDSYWNMNATLSHTKTLTPDQYVRFHDKWTGLVKNEILIWLKFIEYWHMISLETPVLLVRFEDLIRDPRQQLERILEFSLRQAPLLPFWIHRIEHATNRDTCKLGSYHPRSASTGMLSIGKSVAKGHFSDDLISYIHETASTFKPNINYLTRFGYDIPEQGFPHNFIKGKEPKIENFWEEPTEVKTKGTTVNEGSLVRPLDCPYGRLMQKWRHSVTNNDREPLPAT
jgi:hypothetical protein